MRVQTSLLGLLLLVTACSQPTEPAQTTPPSPQPTATVETEPADEDLSTPPIGRATQATRQANTEFGAQLALDEPTDVADAERGFLAALQTDAIRNDKGDIVWQINAYDFLEGTAPATVNPSLWRQSRLAAHHGLFEVTEGIYQVRGYDLAVMSIVRGETGWIVIDPLLTKETAAASLQLVNDTLGARPVSAVLFTHSHADHFGGARGVIDPERAIPIIAPDGFSASAVSENLLAGSHMARRSSFMFGNDLLRSATGHVGSGLGPGLANGTVGLVLPTEEIPAPGATRIIDGVTFEFMDAKNTEAPAEFVFYLPEFKALCTSEVATATFHNALTLRGAKARDTLHWSKVIDDMLVRYANRAEVVFASHHWPTWGADNVRDYLRQQRDIYRYTHDQALRLANSGATGHEIANTVEAPDFSSETFHVRDYYGTLNHNLKAVYQFYFGWWDGVPANYHLLPPEQRAAKQVAAMGGIESALQHGKEAFAAGDYRWAADVLNQIVFTAPENSEARDWLAAAYEQIGFQSESGAWRSYYLSAAQELREGRKQEATDLANADFIAAVPTLDLFDALATRYTPGSIEEAPYVLAFSFTDTAEQITVEVGAETAFPRLGAPKGEPLATFETTRETFDRMILGQASPQMLVLRGKLKISGKRGAVQDFFGALETPDPTFNIIEP